VLATSIAVLLGALAVSNALRPHSPTSSRSSEPAPIGRAHFSADGLAFEYPAVWHVSHYDNVSSFTTLIAYLSAVDVRNPFVTTKQEDVSETACGENFDLPNNGVVLELVAAGNPTTNLVDRPPADSHRLDVDGLPAFVHTANSGPGGASQTITWTIARPGSVSNDFELEAFIRGPDLAGRRGLVEGVVSSIHFDPQVVPLPTGVDATRILNAGLARFLSDEATESPVYDCFPRVAGTSRPWIVRDAPNGPTVGKPLDATCSTRATATALQLWKVDLGIAWPAAADHARGMSTTTIWIDPNAQPGQLEGSGDRLPFEP
jgi:hypothetical protein